MNGEAIREFLVKLAYAVDEQSKNRFVESVVRSTANVLKLAAAVQATAVGVVAATAKMAAGLESVYFASRRTGAEAERLMALGHAAKQAGVSVEGVSGSVEGLARFLRMNPGGEGFLNNLGVQTRDAKGQLRDMTELLFDFANKTRNMPLHQAAAYGSIFGLDAQTLGALRSGEIQKHFEEYRRMVRQTGVDIEGATRNSNAFMTVLRNLAAVFDVIRIAATDALQRSIGPQLEEFRRWLIAHSREIAGFIGDMGKGFMELARLVGQAGKAAWDMGREAVAAYQSMDKGGQDAVKAVGLLLAGWLALNAGILASPIGAIGLLAGAIVALYNDYKTWMDGGKSVINWGVWSKELADAKAGLTELRDAIAELFGPAATSAAEAAGAKFKEVWASAFSDPIGNTVREIKNLIVWYGHLAQLMAAIARGDLQGATKAAGDMMRHVMGTDGQAPGNPQLFNGADSPGDAARPSLLRRFQGWMPEALGGGGGWAGGGAGGASTGPETAHAPIAGQGFKERAPDVMARLQADLGLTPEQAAGILGNLGQESGLQAINERNPLVPGSRGGFGWAQWTGSRRTQFEAWAANRGLDVKSDEANYGFLAHELRNGQSRHLEALRQAKTPEEAARAFFPYESGGDPRVAYGARDRFARDAMEAYRARTANAQPAGAPAAPEPSRGWRLSGAMGRGMGDRFASPGIGAGAGQGAGGTTIAPVLNQRTEINVQGRADAERIAAAQNRVNQEGIRNLMGAFR